MGVAKYIASYGMTWTAVRVLLYRRQAGCRGKRGERLPLSYLHTRDANTEHVRPWAHGGRDSLEDIQMVRRACSLVRLPPAQAAPGRRKSWRPLNTTPAPGTRGPGAGQECEPNTLLLDLRSIRKDRITLLPT